MGPTLSFLTLLPQRFMHQHCQPHQYVTFVLLLESGWFLSLLSTKIHFGIIITFALSQILTHLLSPFFFPFEISKSHST